MSRPMSMPFYSQGYATVPVQEYVGGGNMGKKQGGGISHHATKLWESGKGCWECLGSQPPGYDASTDKFMIFENKRIGEDTSAAAFAVMGLFTIVSVFINKVVYFYTSTRLDLDILSRSIIFGLGFFFPHIIRARIVMDFEENVCHWMYSVIYTPTWMHKVRRFFLVGFQQCVLFGFEIASSAAAYQAVNGFTAGPALPHPAPSFLEGILMVGGLSALGTFIHFTVQYRVGQDRSAYARMAEGDLELSHLDAAVVSMYKAFCYLLLYALIGTPLDSIYILTCAMFNTNLGNTAANYIGAIFIGQAIFGVLNWFYNLHLKGVVIGRRKHLESMGDPIYETGGKEGQPAS